MTSRDPDEVVLSMPHLNRQCTVRLAAINAAMAGCRPEYFPVVLAAWESLAEEGYPARAIWQSTTGTAPFLIVNGPVREQIGMNSQGNVFGSGFRANATIGRAIRLTAINAFGLRPHQLDQATQGTPAKYTACIAENEEESPWPPLHVQFGLDPSDSAVTAMVIRSCVHIEARHTTVPEQLALDIAGTVSRTGALIHETISALRGTQPRARAPVRPGRLEQARPEPVHLRSRRTQPRRARGGGQGRHRPADPLAAARRSPGRWTSPLTSAHWRLGRKSAPGYLTVRVLTAGEGGARWLAAGIRRCNSRRCAISPTR